MHGDPHFVDRSADRLAGASNARTRGRLTGLALAALWTTGWLRAPGDELPNRMTSHVHNRTPGPKTRTADHGWRRPHRRAEPPRVVASPIRLERLGMTGQETEMPGQAGSGRAVDDGDITARCCPGSCHRCGRCLA